MVRMVENRGGDDGHAGEDKLIAWLTESLRSMREVN